jgi:uncharacterized protein (DUF302 family)
MRILLSCFLTVFFAIPALATDGMISLPSHHSVGDTSDRLVNLLETKGMTVFSRIDHAAGAQKVGIDLRPTALIIFGNPKVGSPLMKCSQSAGIDLPQKALIYQDEQGQVWLSYNDPAYLKDRHQIKGCEQVLNKITGALNKFATGATAK